jgi:hypothetical protein
MSQLHWPGQCKSAPYAAVNGNHLLNLVHDQAPIGLVTVAKEDDKNKNISSSRRQIPQLRQLRRCAYWPLNEHVLPQVEEKLSGPGRASLLQRLISPSASAFARPSVPQMSVTFFFLEFGSSTTLARPSVCLWMNIPDLLISSSRPSDIIGSNSRSTFSFSQDEMDLRPEGIQHPK